MSAVAMVSSDYLLRHVARGDGRPVDGGTTVLDAASPLTRYYTGDGYPPGRWIGAGLAGLAHGAGVTEGTEVLDVAMHRLFDDRVDPVTGDALLSRRPPRFVSRAERVERRVRALLASHPDMLEQALDQAAARIVEEESRIRPRHAVLGFDLTFKPPKSVSVLWAVADHGVQVQLYEAHQEALAATLELIEAHMLFTRTGTQGVRRVRTRGLVGAAFDHWDSRAGDPLLHTHVTVANAVQADDGVWRTIDSASLLRATVAASETYNVLVADAVTRRLGLGWERRGREGRDRNPGRELSAVGQDLVDEFSGRSARIQAVAEAAVAAFTADRGRPPSLRQLHRIRQAATLSTRTGKHVMSLDQATQGWRRRAAGVLGVDPVQWVRIVTARATADEPGHRSTRPVLLAAADLTGMQRQELAARTVDVVASRRSTWSRWNLHAEAMRQLSAAGLQFTSAGQAWEAADAVVAEATRLSLDLTPPQLASTPESFVDEQSGRSQFSPAPLYTSRHVLAAEDRLVDLSRRVDGPAVGLDRAVGVAGQPLPGRDYALDVEDQAPAAVAVATSGRTVDVLVGPAGTGKTTTMAGLRAIWEAEFGPGSVAGLAPSAKASQVLAQDLGLATDNTAQWLAQQDIQPERARRLASLRGLLADASNQATRTRLAAAVDRLEAEYRRWSLTPGQLLIVDEAGMAGTFALDRLAGQAAAAGAKLLLVGDPHQLSPVEAGGAFGMLVADRPDPAQLSVIRRFAEPDGQRRRWEEQASLGLRLGDARVIDSYLEHGRVHSGDRDDMVDAAYTAWREDTAAGRRALLIARDNATVRELNARARTDLVDAGRVEASGVTLHDGAVAGRGDRIVTREIDRYLADGTRGFAPAGRPVRRSDGFVRNGQQWQVEAANADGSLIVRLLDPTLGAAAVGAASVTLPAGYVAEHVELAYAATAHRAQGMTVDSAHTLADASVGCEVFDVAMTRGRLSNHCYLSLAQPGEGDGAGDGDHSHSHDAAEPLNDRDVLVAILGNAQTELSARQTIAAVQDRAGSLATLMPQYSTLAGYGRDLHAGGLVLRSRIAGAQELVNDPDFRTVVHTVTAAAAAGVPADRLAAQLLATYRTVVPTVDELAETVRGLTRAHQITTSTGPAAAPRSLLAGLIPDATAAVTDPQVLRAMQERAVLIGARVDALYAAAVADPPRWLPPQPPGGADPAWTNAVRTALAYRDRWTVTDPDTAAGPRLTQQAGMDQRMDQRRVDAAMTGLTGRPDPARVGAGLGSTDTVVDRRGSGLSR